MISIILHGINPNRSLSLKKSKHINVFLLLPHYSPPLHASSPSLKFVATTRLPSSIPPLSNTRTTIFSCLPPMFALSPSHTTAHKDPRDSDPCSTPPYHTTTTLSLLHKSVVVVCVFAFCTCFHKWFCFVRVFTYLYCLCVFTIPPAAMSNSDRSEHSDADTHKSVDIGDSGQPKNNTFRGSKSEFHPALAISDIRNHILVILEM